MAASEQYLYKPGKNHVVACGFPQRAPIPLQGSMAEYTDSSVQLGCALDSRFDETAHLELILSRGPWKIIQVLHELMNLGLPFTALRASLLNRVLPAAAFGIELVVHVSGFEKKLNSLQAFWLRKALGCGAIPRIVLMRELGIVDRLSALAWTRAISLRRRSKVDPRYRQEDAIMNLAASEPSSWSAAVEFQTHILQLPPTPSELFSCELLSTQRQAKLRHHVQLVIQPAVRSWESKQWQQLPRNQQHWARYSFDAWTLADLDHCEIAIPAAQAWAQLKLHGFFFDGQNVPRAQCSFCNKDVLECTSHLFFDCFGTYKLIGHLLDSADETTRLHVGSNLPDVTSVLKWIDAVWKLQRNRKI